MEFSINHIFHTTPKTLFHSWLHSAEHARMTGADAEISPVIGNAFTAWDGYISGTILELQQDAYIKMAWRTTEFSEEQEYSIVEIYLTEKSKNKTLLTLHHTHLKDDDIQYKQGWIDFYWKPMEEMFNV